jgi:hypothetical protein
MKIVPPKGGSPEVGMFGYEGVAVDEGAAVAGGAVGGEGAADVGGTLRGGDGGDGGETADPPPPHATLVNAATKAKVTILIMVRS